MAEPSSSDHSKDSQIPSSLEQDREALSYSIGKRRYSSYAPNPQTDDIERDFLPPSQHPRSTTTLSLVVVVGREERIPLPALGGHSPCQLCSFRWIEENFESAPLQKLISLGVEGPLADVLAPGQQTIAVFSKLSHELLECAQNLADYSKFPVTIQPDCAYPVDSPNEPTSSISPSSSGDIPAPSHASSSSSSGSREILSGYFVTPGIQAGIQSDPPAPELSDSGDQSSPMEGVQNNGITYPSYPPNGPDRKCDDRLVVHSVCVDIHVKNPQTSSGKNSIKLLWRLYFYPYPNNKLILPQEPLGFTYTDELSVQINVKETCKASFHTRRMFSNFGFFKPSKKYHSSQLVEYDNILPDIKLTSTGSKQRQIQAALQAGLASMKPTVLGSGHVNWSKGMGGEAEQCGPNPQWIVENDGPAESQSGFSWYEKVSIRPNPVPFYNHVQSSSIPLPLKATYGMTLDAEIPPNEEGPAFKHVSQVHTWFGGDQPRGIAFLFVHYLDNACTSEASRVSGNISVQLKDGVSGDAKVVTRPSRQEQEQFGLACAPLPESSTRKQWLSRFKRRKVDPQGIQVQGIKASGWDHTHREWLEFPCPVLDEDMDNRGEVAYKLHTNSISSTGKTSSTS
ncbi:hypothetical protein DL96DRAFT_1687149 [Flagelloscypha sp. PMI_526]|nr:hypothetical protein DL96DRAFT_1687149 [Flagelloscypha sp. PMI_526]